MKVIFLTTLGKVPWLKTSWQLNAKQVVMKSIRFMKLVVMQAFIMTLLSNISFIVIRGNKGIIWVQHEDSLSVKLVIQKWFVSKLPALLWLFFITGNWNRDYYLHINFSKSLVWKKRTHFHSVFPVFSELGNSTLLLGWVQLSLLFIPFYLQEA